MVIDYEKIKARNKELRQVLIVPEQNGQSWQWTDAMNGEGAPLPDAVYWKDKYEKLLVEANHMRRIIVNLNDRLTRKVPTEGGKENDL